MIAYRRIANGRRGRALEAFPPLALRECVGRDVGDAEHEAVDDEAALPRDVVAGRRLDEPLELRVREVGVARGLVRVRARKCARPLHVHQPRVHAHLRIEHSTASSRTE